MLKRILASTVLLAAVLAGAGAAPAKLTGGNGTLYIGGWPNKIFIIDEATEKIAGTIDVTTAGPPKRRSAAVDGLSRTKSASI